MKRQRHSFLSLIMGFFFLTGLGAQGEEVDITLAHPYNTMLVHLHFLQAETYEPARSARVFEGIRDSMRGVRLAIKLKQIYDGEGLFVRMNTIPKDSNYVDSLTRNNIFTPFPRELPDIYLEKMGGQWYYSEESVAAIPVLHQKVYPFGTNKILNLLPRGAQQKVLGLMYWQWLGLFIVLGLGLLLYFVFAWMLNPIVSRLSRSRLYPSLIGKRLIRRLTRLISFWVIVKLLRIVIPSLQMPIEVNTVAITLLKLLTIIIFVGIGLRVLDVVMAYVERATQKTESKMDEQLVPLLSKVLQVLIVAIAVLSALRLFNVNITALIAGISIGGLAIALAAQDTLKNLFGSFTIFVDKPFQIGDWVHFDGVDGTVEEVGFRSTRVRTFANSLVSVPNGKLADLVINNYGLRVYRRYSTKLTIAYDTPPALIEQFIEGLKEMVIHHPDTRKDYYEIHLNEMSASSLDILFYIFFSVKDWSSELSAKHDLLMNILRLAARLGVRFAYPTSTIHIEEFPGNGRSSPAYDLDTKATDAKRKAFIEEYKQKYQQRS